MTEQPQALASAFPPPSEADWLKLVDKVLKGAARDSLLTRTADGLDLKPLYVAGDGAPVSVAKSPCAEKAAGWDVRSLVDPASPAEANRWAIEDLRGGAASLLLAVDPSGETGVAVASAEAMGLALNGVLLDIAPVALAARGFIGPLAAQWLGAAAKRGPEAKLAFHLDPLGDFAEAGRSPGPLAAHLARAARAGSDLAIIYPKASLFLANGRAVHEAGGTDAQELGVMASAIVAYLKALTEAGLSAERALAAITLGVSVDGDFLAGIAKLRAARLLWSQIAGACGVASPARIEVRSSRRMLTRLDPWTNLLRLTSAAFAAGTGGADAVVLDPFTAALGQPHALARRQARNIQLVLQEEAHLGAVQDPARGAWALDARTRALTEAAWAIFVDIEGAGGLETALKTGILADRIEAARDARQAEFAEGRAQILGVTLHRAASEATLNLPHREAAPHATSGPDVSLAGPDDTATPLAPIRWSVPVESAA